MPAHKVTFPSIVGRLPTDPDSNVTAPLRVGDYVTMNGIEVEGGLFAVYLLNANLGFYTAPGEHPAYIVVVNTRIAMSVPKGVVHVPETAQVMGTAFTTDPSIPMYMNMIDVDPCTGAETDRHIIPSQPFGNAIGQVFGEALFRPGNLILDPMTRNVGFKLVNGQSVTANGLIAGQYVQPVFDFIAPEITVFGDNMFALNFSAFPYLSQGSGPFISQVAGNSQVPGPIVSRLKPWPEATIPAALNCPAPSSVASSAAPTSTDIDNGGLASVSAAIAQNTNALGPIPTSEAGPAPFTAEAQEPFIVASPVSEGPNAVSTAPLTALTGDGSAEATSFDTTGGTDAPPIATPTAAALSAAESSAAPLSTLATVASPVAKLARQASDTSTAAAPTTSVIATPDFVTITNVSQLKDMGGFTLSFDATSSHTEDPLPTLIATGTGTNPLGAIPMISLGGGFYTLSIEFKHGSGLTSLTVTSSDGGSETLTEANGSL